MSAATADDRGLYTTAREVYTSLSRIPPSTADQLCALTMEPEDFLTPNNTTWAPEECGRLLYNSDEEGYRTDISTDLPDSRRPSPVHQHTDHEVFLGPSPHATSTQHLPATQSACRPCCIISTLCGPTLCIGVFLSVILAKHFGYIL